MEVPFLDLRAVYLELGRELDEAAQHVLASGRYVLGPELVAFEQEFAHYCGVAHCVGVSSGLDALELTLRAWGIGPGDDVIVPAHTFIATWLAVSHCGATPVPVEPDLETYNIDPARIEEAITGRTRAIIPVHLYGHPADMATIEEISRRHDVRVLEDAAQAHGARLNGRPVGSFGNAAAFSFYPAKNLGALGDGGAIVTDDAELARKLRRLRSYGSEEKYQHLEPGFNHRLDELQAALLRVKLRYLHDWNRRRLQVARRYLAELPDTDLKLPTVRDGAEPSWHLFVVRSSDRNRLQQRLSEAGIETLIHYPIPPHLSPAYRSAGWLHVALPITEEIAATCLSLPMHPRLDPEQVSSVVRAAQRCSDRTVP